ncbi:MAG TPA: sulfotransferase family protein [Crenotrichaceae bacterium]|nr:sulfotransferase family protein [Crenotrichaceae bacterium]
MQAVKTTLKAAENLIASGKLDEAELLCERILNKNPHQSDALHLSGLIALNKKQYERAIQKHTQTTTINPDNPIYHYNLGQAYLRANLSDSAVKHLRKAATLKPNMASAHRDLCHILVITGDIKTAISSGKKAVSLAPEDAVTHYNLAIAYNTFGDFNSSFKSFHKASQLQPDNPRFQFDLGKAYISYGDTVAARKCFKNVIKLQPNQLVAYANMVRITKYDSPEHEDVIQLKKFLNQPQLSDQNRVDVLFSLGKIYQDCSLYDEAFSYFKEGNKLQDNKYRFNPAEPALAASLLIDNCTSELFSRKHKISSSTEKPIFIVGAPRSGTTLVEQILSSHHNVFGAGELHWFPETSSKLQQYLKTTLPYPNCLNKLTKSSTKKLALQYSKYTQTLANGERRITDKMPGNFLHLGFIHILFPNAKIIHCRRDPRDTCISMFCHQFPSGVPYSYDLYKLGAFYSQYERIMEHWHKVLPEDTMIEVEYENLINNQETESHRLLDFLGLKWHDNCLSFYKQKRAIHTASDTQVTKPLYSSSIGRWKNYQTFLQPLEDGFNYKKD